ncbi:transmembrane protein [Cystoisospora suis]|uniref:Transmembrane protein n=1 Tax=Cystoisospora suis TaxID=483139 RepID=A0A2C6KQM2_9APIC|nr:transmembrane protein [Cystoisospora suis]
MEDESGGHSFSRKKAGEVKHRELTTPVLITGAGDLTEAHCGGDFRPSGPRNLQAFWSDNSKVGTGFRSGAGMAGSYTPAGGHAHEELPALCSLSSSMCSSGFFSSVPPPVSSFRSPLRRVDGDMDVPSSSLSTTAIPETLASTTLSRPSGDVEGRPDCPHVGNRSSDRTRIRECGHDIEGASHFRAPAVFPSAVSPSPSAAASLLLFMRTGFLHRKTRHTRRFARRFLILDRHILFSFKTIPLRCSSVCAYTSHLVFARDALPFSSAVGATSSSSTGPYVTNGNQEEENPHDTKRTHELVSTQDCYEPSLPNVFRSSSLSRCSTKTHLLPSTKGIGELGRCTTPSDTPLPSTCAPGTEAAAPFPSARAPEVQPSSSEVQFLRAAEDSLPSLPGEEAGRTGDLKEQDESHSMGSMTSLSPAAFPHDSLSATTLSDELPRSTLLHSQHPKISDYKVLREPSPGAYSSLAVTTDWSAADLFDFSQATCAWDLRTARLANFSYDKQQKGFTWVLHAPNVLQLGQQQEQLRRKQRQQQHKEQKLLLAHQKRIISRNESSSVGSPTLNRIDKGNALSLPGNLRSFYDASRHTSSPEPGASTKEIPGETTNQQNRFAAFYHKATEPTAYVDDRLGSCSGSPYEEEECGPSGLPSSENDKTHLEPGLPSQPLSFTSLGQTAGLLSHYTGGNTCRDDSGSQAERRREGKLGHLRKKIRSVRGSHEHGKRLSASHRRRRTCGSPLKSDGDSNGDVSSCSHRSSSSVCSASGGELEEEEERLLLVTAGGETYGHSSYSGSRIEDDSFTQRNTGDADVGRASTSTLHPEDQQAHVPSRIDMHGVQTPQLQRETSCPALSHQSHPTMARRQTRENLSYFDDLFQFPDLPPPATCMETLTFCAPDVVTAHDWVFALLACSEVGSPAALYVHFRNLQLYSNACTDGLPHWLWPIVEWAEKKETQRRAQAAKAGALSVGVSRNAGMGLSRENSTASSWGVFSSTPTASTGELLSSINDGSQKEDSNLLPCISSDGETAAGRMERVPRSDLESSGSVAVPPVFPWSLPPSETTGSREIKWCSGCTRVSPADNTSRLTASASGREGTKEQMLSVLDCSEGQEARLVHQRQYRKREMVKHTSSCGEPCPSPSSPAWKQSGGRMPQLTASPGNTRNVGVVVRPGKRVGLTRRTQDCRPLRRKGGEEDRESRSDKRALSRYVQPYLFNPWSLLPPPSSSSCSLLSVVLHSFEGASFPSGYTPYALLSFQSSLYPCLLIPGAPDAPASSPFLPLPTAVVSQTPGSFSLFQKLFSRAAPHPVPPFGPCRFSFRPAPCLNLPVFFPSRNQQDLLIHLYAAPPPSQSPNVSAGASGKKTDKSTADAGLYCNGRSLGSNRTGVEEKLQSKTEVSSPSRSMSYCFPPSSQGPPAHTLAPFVHSLPSLSSPFSSTSNAVSLSLASPLTYYLGSVAVPSHLFGTTRRQRLSLPIYSSSSHPLEDACRTLPTGGQQQHSTTGSQGSQQLARTAAKALVVSGDRLEVSVLLPTLWANSLQPVEEVFDTPQPFLDGPSVAVRAASAADAAGGGGGSWLPVQQLLLQIKRLGRLRDRISQFCSLAAFIFEFTSPRVSFFSLFYLLFGLLFFQSRFLGIVLLPLLLLIVSRHPDASSRLLSFLCDFPVFLLFTSQRTLASILCSAQQGEGSLDNGFPRSSDACVCAPGVSSSPDTSGAAQMLLLLIKHQHWWAVSPSNQPAEAGSQMPAGKSGFDAIDPPKGKAEDINGQTGISKESFLTPIFVQDGVPSYSPCLSSSVFLTSKETTSKPKSRDSSEDAQTGNRAAILPAQHHSLYGKVNICSCFAPGCCPWLLPPPLPLLLLPPYESKEETLCKDITRGLLSWVHWFRVLLAFSVAGGVLPASSSLFEMISEDFYCRDSGVATDHSSAKRVGATHTEGLNKLQAGTAAEKKGSGEGTRKESVDGGSTTVKEASQIKANLEREVNFLKDAGEQAERSIENAKEKPTVETINGVLSYANQTIGAEEVEFMESPVEDGGSRPSFSSGEEVREFASLTGGCDSHHFLQTDRLGRVTGSGASEPDRQYGGTTSPRGTSCLSSDASAGSRAPVGETRVVHQAGMGGRTSVLEDQGPSSTHAAEKGSTEVDNRAACGFFPREDLENNVACAPAVVAPSDSGEETCWGRDRQGERTEKTRTMVSKMKSDGEHLVERDEGKATDLCAEVHEELQYEQTEGTGKEEATTALASYQDIQKDSSRGLVEGGEPTGLYGSKEDTLPSVRLAVGDSTSSFPLLLPSTSSSPTQRQMCNNPVIVDRDDEMEDQQEDENAKEVQNAPLVQGEQPDHLSRCEPSEPSSIAPPAFWEGRNTEATCSAPLRRNGTAHTDESPHSPRRSHHHHRPSWGRHYPPTETETGRGSSKLCTVGDAATQQRRQSEEDKELRRPSLAHHEGLFKGVAQFARKWVKKHLHSTHGDERQPVPFAVSINGHSRSPLPSENRPNYPVAVSSATRIMANEPGGISRPSPREDGGWARNSREMRLNQDIKEQETRDKQKEPPVSGEGRGLLCFDPSACVPLAAGSVDLLQFGDVEDYFAYHSLEQKGEDFHHPPAVIRPSDNSLRQQGREEAREDTMTVAISESVREGRYHQKGERRARFSDDMPQPAEGGKVTPEYDSSPRHPRSQKAETANRRRPQSPDVRRNEKQPVLKTSVKEGTSEYRETGSPVPRRIGRGQERGGDEREAFRVATEKDCGVLGTSGPLCVICAASLTSPNKSLYLDHQNDHVTDEPFSQSFLDRFIFPYFLPRFTPRDASFGALLPPRDPPFTPSCSCWYAKYVSCTSSTRECSLDVLPACRSAVSDSRSLEKTSTGGRQGPADSARGCPLTDSSTKEKSYLIRGSPFSGSSSALPDSGGRKGRKAGFPWGFRRRKNHHTDPGLPCELHVFRPAPFDTPSSCAACLEALLILLTNRRPPPEVAAFVFSNFSSKVFPACVPLQSPEGPPSVLAASLFSRSSCNEATGGEGIDTSAACRFAMLSDANQVADGLSVSAVNASFDTVPPDVLPPSPSGGSSLPGGELLTLYKDFRASASRFLVKLWRWVVLGEKVCNLFSWKNRGITQIATILFAGMVLVLLAVPLQYILVLWVVHAFIAGQKRGLWNLLSRQCACRHVEAAIYQIVSAERASSNRRRKGTSPPSSNKKRTASTTSLRADYGGGDTSGYADGVRAQKQTELRDRRHLDSPALLRFLTVPQLHQLQRSLWRRCRVWLSLDILSEALDEAQVGEAVRRGRTETTVSTSRWARPDWMTNLLMHAPTDVTHQPTAILLRDSRSLFAGGELLPSENDAINLAVDTSGSAAVESWEGTTVTGAEDTRPCLEPATQGEDDAHETDESDESAQ